MTYTLEQLLAMVIVVSFLGFCLEHVWILLRHGFIDNRNMRLPFLTGYGLTVLGFYKLAGIPTEENQRAYFAFAFLIVSAGEIVMGKLTEWTMHIYYWDYSTIPLHITRYTSIPTSLGFAAIIVLFMKYGFTAVMAKIAALPAELLRLTRLIMVVLLYDMMHCYRIMYQTRSHYVVWKHTLPWRRNEAEEKRAQ